MQCKVSNSKVHSSCYHNLSGYDVHLFIRESIGLIAENKEKYITFNTDIIVGR